MLTVIGTSHISPESVGKVVSFISSKKPDVVALELDRRRLQALLSGSRGGLRLSDIRRVGWKGWLFASFGSWVEHRLGDKVGVLPGAEMLEAYKAAKSVSARVELVDQDIEVTLRRISLTWREKFNLFVDFFNALFGRETVSIDISKVPSSKLISRLVNELKVRYPSLFRVVVEERNFFIARRLAVILKKFPDRSVLAVIGAGHEREVLKLVKEYLNKLDIA